MTMVGNPGADLPLPGDAQLSQSPADPDPPKAHLSAGQRVLEILPGLATWTVIAGLVILPTLVYPTVVVGAVIVIDIYWFVRSVLVTRGIRHTFQELKTEMAIDWYRRCLELPEPAWTDADGAAYDPREIYHAALIPTYTEKYEALQATVAARDAASYPADRTIVASITRTTDIGGVRSGPRPPPAQ